MAEIEKLVRFLNSKGATCYGRLRQDTIIALEGDIFTSPREKGETYRLEEVKLLAPCQPSKAVCVGLNYKSHAEEMKLKIPEEPVIFLKPSTSVIGPGEKIIYWPMVGRLDYEAELVVVIGKYCHNVSEREAPDYIFGYTIGMM